jgi:hypothetical protein
MIHLFARHRRTYSVTIQDRLTRPAKKKRTAPPVCVPCPQNLRNKAVSSEVARCLQKIDPKVPAPAKLTPSESQVGNPIRKSAFHLKEA